MTLEEWIGCDSCSARALWQANGKAGSLTFCGHHKDQYSEALDTWAYEMLELNKVDEIPILEKAAI